MPGPLMAFGGSKGVQSHVDGSHGERLKPPVTSAITANGRHHAASSKLEPKAVDAILDSDRLESDP
jgi:hypothetical protein